jgi:hypothetical protein
MPFTGKATYSAGSTLPEIAEDVSDIVSVSSPFDTPLLDVLGDPARSARSTVHEWLEDTLLPNTDPLVAVDGSTVTVTDGARFRVGDLLRVDGFGELMLVESIADNELAVARGYGGTTPGTPDAGAIVHIVGNAALEGDDADAARFTVRQRRANYTQIFSKTVEVSGSELAVRQLGVRDELNYLKAQRLRELMRDLENCVINGVAPSVDPQGAAGVRRSMRGIVSFITSNRLSVGDDGFPADTALTEEQLNLALRTIWQRSNGNIDLVVVGGPEKRAINQFVTSNRRFFTSNETYKDLVSAYESDFGVCRVVLSRHMPRGTVLLLDSSKIEVMPLAGRSFQYHPLARTGDRESGQLVGEYTLEFRNEACHGLISGFTGE